MDFKEDHDTISNIVRIKTIAIIILMVTMQIVLQSQLFLMKVYEVNIIEELTGHELSAVHINHIQCYRQMSWMRGGVEGA